MNCNNTCKKYKATRESIYSFYESGFKRCTYCEIFLDYAGGWCPCCSTKLRFAPRNNRGRNDNNNNNNNSPEKPIREFSENNLARKDLLMGEGFL